jgi:hypothetical protein
MTLLGGALRALGGLGGSALGGLVGMGSAGGNFGSGLGASLSQWLGSGDYTVSSNSIVQRASAGTVPSMHREGQSITVRHKEFLTEIRGSTTFLVRNEFPLNPGLQTTFPWLSALAAQYAEYRFKGIVFHYVPSSGMVTAATPALGTVMLQTSYRATEAVATSKIELLNEYWSSEAVPCKEFCHPIECDPKENPFNVQYIRSGSLPSTENQLMYDLGRTTVAVSGQSADDIVLGDLWVTYEVELKKPVVTNLNNTDIQCIGISGTTTITAAAPLGTVRTLAFNSFPVVPTMTSSTITIPRGAAGVFSFVGYWQGVTALAGFAPSISGGAFTTLVGSSTSYGSDYSTGTGQGMASFYFTINNPDTATVITLGFGTLTAASIFRCIITEVNPSCIVV